MFGVQALVPAYEDSYKVWYPKLRHPSWNPPPWVFPAVWIPLKLLQSVRSRIVHLTIAVQLSSWISFMHVIEVT